MGCPSTWWTGVGARCLGPVNGPLGGINGPFASPRGRARPGHAQKVWPPTGGAHPSRGTLMADLAYVLLIVAGFAVLVLTLRGLDAL